MTMKHIRILFFTIAVLFATASSCEKTPPPTPVPPDPIVPVVPEEPQNPTPTTKNYTSLINLRAKFTGTEFTITEDLYIKGTVISNFRRADAGGLNNATSAKSVVVSDGEAGISLRLLEDNATFAKDDEVSISLKGAKMQLYQGLLQINELPNDQIEKIGTKPLTAVPITAAQLLSGKYESMYVAVKNVQVAKSDIGKKLGDKNSHTSINFVSKEGEEFVLFSSKYSTFMDDVVPSGSGFLKGVAMVFGNTYQVAITAKSDLEGLTDERFNQDGPNTPPVTELKSDPVYSWMELPKVVANEGQAYISHFTTINGKEVRNYSMLYDSNNKISLWVAYPLCSDYIGGTGRSDEWEYDPKVPHNMQPVLYKSYSNSGTYGRGHQIPSADRTVSHSTNAQTFYFTNMTPQHHNLNGRVWAELESLVRNAAKTCDTLYVVTGPIIKTDAEPNIEYTADNNGAKVAIPKGYFKVLLKYTKNTSSYSAVGFWYENEEYSEGRKPIAADAYSLEAIEKKSGHTFFNNLPAEVKSSLSSSYKASDWGL